MININKEYYDLTFSDVVGMNNQVEFLETVTPVPQVGLFYGPVGCGKNLLAYLLSQRLPNVEISVRDSVDNTAAAAVNIIGEFSAPPFLPKTHQVCVLNEFHLFRKDAQRKFLDILQSPPERTYFFVCTIEPGRLEKDIYSRFRFKLCVRELNAAESFELVTRVCDNLGLGLKKAQKLQIASQCSGVPRTIINTLTVLSSMGAENPTPETIITVVGKQSAPEVDSYFWKLYEAITTNVQLHHKHIPTLVEKTGLDAEAVRYKILYHAKRGFGSPKCRKVMSVFLKRLEPGAEEYDLILRVNELIGR